MKKEIKAVICRKCTGKVVFTETAKSTKVNVTVTFASREGLKKITSIGFKEGFSAVHENLDKLPAQ